MNLEGRLLGNRYEILEKIGNGGMATVYKAKCHVLNRLVAVKVLRDEFTTDPEFIKRFEIEAQSAASITHSNIVSVYDVGVDNNLYYIVMELVQGKTLKEIIVEENGPLPWKWSVNIAIQVASALETAHRNNIIHRDIKPHNIIITEDGIAKVTDFGIAKAVSNSTITAFGSTIGSVHYFSPEHARGGYTDAKSDLYSLGVVMYEMLTGRVPFDADTPVSVALKHMQEEPIEPIKINASMPKAVNDIIMKALKKDTNLRYSSSTEMLKDLKEALKDPNGNFVETREEYRDFATQKISTLNYESEKEKKKKKNNKFIAFIKKHKFLSSIVGLALLFTISLGGTILYFDLTNPKEVLLPNLVGMQKEAAQQMADSENVILEISGEEYNSEYQPGYIISQDPPFIENYNIKETSTIKIVVSKGIETAIVPKVKGKEKTEAIEEIENAKLKCEVQQETSKTIQEGYVIRQDKEEGEVINAGDTVTIYVSSGTGIKQVAVSSVIGSSIDSATSTLTEQGLKVEVVYDEDSTKDDGTVLKQSIDVGKTVDEGTKITLTVNKLAQMVTGTVNVNVKSLLGGKIEYEESNDENEIETEKKVKKVSVKIMIDNDTVYKESVDPTTTNISQTITGKGTVNIKVYIDDVLKKSGTLNLNNETVYTAE